MMGTRQTNAQGAADTTVSAAATKAGTPEPPFSTAGAAIAGMSEKSSVGADTTFGAGDVAADSSAGEAVAAEASDHNQAVVAGTVSAEPQRRELPSGSVAVSMSVRVRNVGQPTTSVPVVWYDPPKRMQRWVAGDDVVLRGRIVRRFFRGAGGLGSSTELVVEAGELRRHRAKAVALVDRATDQLAAWAANDTTGPSG